MFLQPVSGTAWALATLVYSVLGANAESAGLQNGSTGDEALDAALREGSANAAVRARVIRRVKDYYARFLSSSPISNARARRAIAVSEVVKELLPPRLQGVDIG
jgi:hypothetical protein